MSEDSNDPKKQFNLYYNKSVIERFDDFYYANKRKIFRNKSKGDVAQSIFETGLDEWEKQISEIEQENGK